MLNQTVLVGRLVKDPELKEAENGCKLTHITLAVPRSYKNVDGQYDTDFISCVLWRGIAENAVEYCHKGDLVGIKGRLQSRNIETDTEKRQITELVAEKVTYLSSNRNKETE
jgi:single-strand DNA-binding protein